MKSKVKYDPDNALFCTVAADIGDTYKESVISYVNPAGVKQFGEDLMGMPVAALFNEILCSEFGCSLALTDLLKKGFVIIEGRFRGRDVQLHSMIDKDRGFFQAAIMDTTESRRAKEGFEYTAGALARASEVNDDTTGTHIIRINVYAKKLAELMDEPREFTEAVGLLAQLHDVGKIHIPENILKKPGSLTPAEYEQMKLHTTFGAKIIGDHPRLAVAKQIALGHHEKWDGTGYPGGLSGDMIPLSAQITAVVDVFDALVSKRPYKDALDFAKVYAIMTTGDERTRPESDFSPRVLRAFLENYNVFSDIYNRMAD